MIVIGVTGGMASGKSTVARMIAGRSILHIDADKLVHQLMRSDHQVIAQIAAAFPGSVVQHKIDRGVLARTVAEHPNMLQILESILHPRVRATEVAMIETARRNRLRAVVLDVPLLFETDADLLCDIVIVAHAPIGHRRRRAFLRPGMTEEKWNRLLDRQLPDHHRLNRADVVIPTTIGKAATRRIIHKLMKDLGL